MVTVTVDLVGIVLFVLLGYLDDLILPRYYFYEDTIVGVYKQYQCPIYCGADHPHLVYYDKEITGEPVSASNRNLKAIHGNETNEEFRNRQEFIIDPKNQLKKTFPPFVNR